MLFAPDLVTSNMYELPLAPPAVEDDIIFAKAPVLNVFATPVSTVNKLPVVIVPEVRYIAFPEVRADALK